MYPDHPWGQPGLEFLAVLPDRHFLWGLAPPDIRDLPVGLHLPEHLASLAVLSTLPDPLDQQDRDIPDLLFLLEFPEVPLAL